MTARIPVFILVVLCGVLAPLGRARAQVPPSNQATLLLRILAYDRNLAKRASKNVTVAVVYKPGNGDSETAGQALADALKEQGEKFVVAGLPLKVAMIKYANAAQLQSAAGAAGAVAVYVCPGLTDDVAAISKV